MHPTAAIDICLAVMSLRISEAPLETKQLDMKNIVTEDQTVIFNLLKTLSGEKKVSFSFKTFPQHIFLTVSDVDKLDLKMLQRVYLVSERVKQISLDFRNKRLIIKIHKANALIKPKIRKRKVVDKKETELAAELFLKDKDIRSEDKRLVKAIVTMFLNWTWNSVACNIEIKKEGDVYRFVVENLMQIAYDQLKQLEALGWVFDVEMQFKDASVLTFNVSRAESIINPTPSKRQRLM